MKMGIVCFVLSFSVLSGCAGSDTVRIDTESDATFEESLSAMQRTLSSEEQVKLIVALLRIRMAGLKSAGEARASIDGGQVLSADELSQVDGLTYSEILEFVGLSGIDAEVLK
jgi:hypothetical protein